MTRSSWMVFLLGFSVACQKPSAVSVDSAARVLQLDVWPGMTVGEARRARPGMYFQLGSSSGYIDTTAGGASDFSTLFLLVKPQLGDAPPPDSTTVRGVMFNAGREEPGTRSRQILDSAAGKAVQRCYEGEATPRALVRTWQLQGGGAILVSNANGAPPRSMLTLFLGRLDDFVEGPVSECPG